MFTKNVSEIKHYQDNGVSFESYKNFQKIIHEKSRTFVFHYNLEKFAKAMGFSYILWTNLCKCENKKNRKLPPKQTFRKRINKFFRKEMALFEQAPIIASGKKPFEIVRRMFPDKFVIRVPHASGSYTKSHFNKLFDEDILKKEYQDKINKNKDTEDKYVELYPE